MMIDMFALGNTVFGLTMTHSFTGLFVIEQAIKEHKPRSIIELGAGRGALSAYLAAWSVVDGLRFVTIDTVPPMYADKIRAIAPNAAVLVGDASADEFLARAQAEFPHPWLIYNDCGSLGFRQDTFDAWAAIAQPGDVQGVHDWPGEWKGWTPPAHVEPLPELNAISATCRSSQQWFIRV